ncbi:MAG: alpha/beta fold hydrolase [Pseudomonadota bacterium]
MIAFTLCCTGLFLLWRANAGVDVERLQLGPTPISVFRAAGAEAGEARPVVVIAHGFAGSQQLMQPFAITLAKNGFLSVTFDYLGHGRNLAPLTGDITNAEGATRALVAQTREVVAFALDLPDAGDDLAVLGHSMASDIVVRYAQSDPRVAATVAVSMFSPVVEAASPKNLRVIGGDLEGFLKQEALRVLGLVMPAPAEGVTVGSFADGTARRVAFADSVEHVGVLYSQESMREARDWLTEVFALTKGEYADRRGLAVVLLLLGVVLLAWPLSRALPGVCRPRVGAALSWRQLLPGALIPAVTTPLVLFWFPADFFGVLVGGYLAVHFFVYGLITYTCVRFLRRSRVPPAKVPVTRLLLSATLATLYVAGLVALVLDTFVASFAVTAPRLPLVLLMFAGTLSYFLADEWLAQGETTAFGGHLFTRLCFLLSLGIAVTLSLEELFFLLIIAAVILIYFLVYGCFSRWIYRATGHPAVGAIANAVAFAWALAAVFPMLAKS